MEECHLLVCALRTLKPEISSTHAALLNRFSQVGFCVEINSNSDQSSTVDGVLARFTDARLGRISCVYPTDFYRAEI